MLWRVSVAVVVVCIGGLCSSVRADLVSSLIVPRDYGVKLCGREFIRAVIFTCGGSRWKRSTDGDLDPFQWNSVSNVPPEDNQQMWKRGAELPDGSPLAAGSYSLADLVNLYGSTSDRQQASLTRPALTVETTDLDEQEGNQDAGNWPIASKKKRNFSLGVAGMCCSQGCTKNDIGRLC